jgi:hypothetical protein
LQIAEGRLVDWGMVIRLGGELCATGGSSTSATSEEDMHCLCVGCQGANGSYQDSMYIESLRLLLAFELAELKLATDLFCVPICQVFNATLHPINQQQGASKRLLAPWHPSRTHRRNYSAGQ